MTRIRNVRRTTKFKRSIKAISPVIATLLMIAIAVVASLVVYAWVTGYIGGSTTKAGKAIQIPSFAVDGSNDLHVYVQNVGQGTVQLSAVYVNDVLKLSPNDVIAEGNTFDVVITGPFDANTKLNVKVTTTEGTFMTATGTPGSNTNPAVSPTPDPSATATPTPGPTTTPTPTPTPTPVTITLRPNAAGSTTELSRSGSGGANWDRVDDTTADDGSTYVYGTGDDSRQTDTYNVPDQSLTGTITNVRIYIRAYENYDRTDVYAWTAIRIGTGLIQYGTQIGTTNAWANYFTDYATKTGNLGSGVWTWADINSLQIGVGLQSHMSSGPTWRYAECTQVWVEVTYTP